MQEIFEKLKDLQKVIYERFLLEKELEELPKSFAKKIEVLNRNKKALQDTRQKIEDQEKNKGNLENELKNVTQKKENLEVQIAGTRTQKEYELLDKEIRETTEREQILRKELIRLDKELDNLREEEKRLLDYVENDQREFEEESQKNAQTEARLRQRISELELEEGRITPDLDPDIVFKFKRIIRSKQGIGIVAIRNGVCTGCHMILPLQFVNDVRKGTRVMFCPHCSRILYFESARTERLYETASATEAGVLADLVDEE